MDAIFELLGALIVGLVQLAALAVQVVLTVLAMLLEFVFVALTEGISAANKRFQDRQQERRESRAETASPADEAKPQTGAKSPPVSRRKTAAVAALVVIGIAVLATTGFVAHQIRKKRIEATEQQIARLADGVIAQIEDEKAADPKAGLLEDRDAWNQPIELFVDDMLIGSMVVVRSRGPDRQSGTLDDLLAIRATRAPAKRIGRELAGRGLRAVRERVERLLPEKDNDEPANDADRRKE